jgi:hypothetical protein
LRGRSGAAAWVGVVSAGFAAVPTGGGAPGAVMMRGLGFVGFGCCLLSSLPGVIGKTMGRAGVDAAPVGASSDWANAVPAVASNAKPVNSGMRRSNFADNFEPLYQSRTIIVPAPCSVNNSINRTC